MQFVAELGSQRLSARHSLRLHLSTSVRKKVQIWEYSLTVPGRRRKDFTWMQVCCFVKRGNYTAQTERRKSSHSFFPQLVWVMFPVAWFVLCIMKYKYCMECFVIEKYLLIADLQSSSCLWFEQVFSSHKVLSGCWAVTDVCLFQLSHQNH